MFVFHEIVKFPALPASAPVLYVIFLGRQIRGSRNSNCYEPAGAIRRAHGYGSDKFPTEVIVSIARVVPGSNLFRYN